MGPNTTNKDEERKRKALQTERSCPRKKKRDWPEDLEGGKSTTPGYAQKANNNVTLGSQVSLRFGSKKITTTISEIIYDEGKQFVMATQNLVIKHDFGDVLPSNCTIEKGSWAGHCAVLVAPKGIPMNEYLNGVSMDGREDLALKLLAEVGAVHDDDVIHNDIKLENVIVLQRGDYSIVKLIDFEISIERDSTLFSNAGTTGYFPPEKEKNEPITTKSDVYSLGIVLGEILHGSLFEKGKKLDDLCEWLETCNNGWKNQIAWKALIKEMVEEKQSKRPTIRDCFNKLAEMKIIGSREGFELQSQAKEKISWSTILTFNYS